MIKRKPFILILLFLSCTSLPKTFKQTNEPNWTTVELRDDITYESAWRSVVDLVVQKFDTEVLDQKEGYIRTKYLDSYSSVVTGIYRVKLVIVKELLKMHQNRYKKMHHILKSTIL